MFAIFKKEISVFFSSLIAYIAIGVFLIGNGIFVWVLQENLFDNGYATLDIFFINAPMIFLFLVPAITMRSFAEEQKTGTIEILSTKPVTDLQIVLGKYFAGLVLVFFSLLPTLFYYYTVSYFAVPGTGIDHGATIGSYIGLLFIGAAYLAIGMFASSITENQIVAFITGMFLCFFFYSLMDYLKSMNALAEVSWLFDAFSIQSHYISISRGVVDTRDLAFFISIITVFLSLTKTTIQSRKS
ncbi:MAG: gliding motility-associated ABC transporter permease subunit GldF [Bacteroidetes bacterium]|nr:gliding motility-associated ABC transporter permease subunit GldF [Bacteroidota bacterium]